MKQGTQNWCSGTTQSDRVGREVEGHSGWLGHMYAVAAAAKSLQSCPTLCDPIEPTRLPHPWDSPGKNIEWVAISFSKVWKWKVKVKSLSRVRLLATPWTTAYQAPLSMGLSRLEYWSGVLLHSLGTHVYPWPIHVVVWQKPPQYCKVIFLQLK